MADVGGKRSVRDLTKRHATRHLGIVYRLKANGSRTYYVFNAGGYEAVQGGEQEALARQAELRARAGRGAPRVVGKPSFEDMAEEWMSASNHRTWTRANYRAALDNVLYPGLGRKTKVAAISADRVAQLIRDLEAKNFAGSYIENLLKPLNGALNLALRRGAIHENPLRLLTRDERPRRDRREHHVWSLEDINTFLAAAKRLGQRRGNVFDYSLLLTVGVYTGLRLGELLGLRWCDVDLAEGHIHVRHQWTRAHELSEPKTPKAKRRIPLAPSLVKRLAEHKLQSTFSSDHDFVFCSKHGTPLNHRNVVSRGFEPALKESGIQHSVKITFHDLRHAFASLCVAQGISSTVLADQMGHSSSGTTEQIYIHLFDRERSDKMIRSVIEAAIGQQTASSEPT